VNCTPAEEWRWATFQRWPPRGAGEQHEREAVALLHTEAVGNFISLQLVGVKSNRAALEAAVTLEQGNDKREQEVQSGDGYISQSDFRLHFGSGKSVKADKIVIRWPSGLVETISYLPANQYYVVREGSGVDKNKAHGISEVRVQISVASAKVT
jgi:hypothetical protein